MRQGREPNGRTIVIRKRLKRPAEWYHAAEQGHAVHRRSHSVLADAIVNIAVLVCSKLKVRRRIDIGIVRWFQVSRTANELWYRVSDRVDHLTAVRTRGRCRNTVKFWQRSFPTFGQLAAADRTEGDAQIGIRLFVFLDRFVPVFF